MFQDKLVDLKRITHIRESQEYKKKSRSSCHQGFRLFNAYLKLILIAFKRLFKSNSDRSDFLNIPVLCARYNKTTPLASSFLYHSCFNSLAATKVCS